VPTICDDADRIKESAKSVLKEHPIKEFNYEAYEKMLSTGIVDQNQQHVPVSKLLVKAKACFVRRYLSNEVEKVKPFSVSTSWLASSQTDIIFKH
jgi:hypothetical protein